MKKYKLILFDLDGTLINSKDDIVASTNYTLEQFGVPALDAQTIHSFVGSGVVQLLGDAISHKLGRPFPVEELKKGEKVFFDHYEEHCLDRTTWYPGVFETLNQLRPDYKMAVLTNKPIRFTEKIIRGLKGDHFFYGMVGGDQEFPKKPDPTGARHLMAQAGCKPAETLMVGDSLFDEETARNAEIDVALVTYGFATQEELSRLSPQYWIQSFADLKPLI